MARPLRVQFSGAVYHVMARGNEGRPIFRDDKDRHRFLDALGEMTERFGVRLHAYCLMLNHYHLLLETPRANLSQAVGWLQVTYTVRFNRRHRRSGHLFQGRFKAQLVEADEYAQGLVEYMHLNPVRPRRKNQPLDPERCAELNAYAWSSHRAYAGLTGKPFAGLCLDWLRYWSARPAEAHREYRRSLRRWFAGNVENPWDELIGGLILGGDKLLAKVQRHLAAATKPEEIRWLQQREQPDLRKRLESMLENEPDRRIKIWARVRLGGERNVAIAREIGYRGGSSVGQIIRRVDQRAVKNKRLRQKLTQFKVNLSRVES